MAMPAPGIHMDVPEHEYRIWPATNQSLLKTFKGRSPAHALYERLHPKAPTEAQELGQAFHVAVLEPDRFDLDYACMRSRVDRRTKEGKVSYAEFQLANEGKTVLRVEDYDAVRGMSEGLWGHPLGPAILGSSGRNELTLRWDDLDTGLACKARIDRVCSPGDRVIAVDLKSAADASKRAFGRAVDRYGYYIQAPFYLAGLEQVSPNQDATRPRSFVFAVVEKEPPYAAAFYELSSAAMEHGARMADHWLKQWAKCEETDYWPGYSKDIELLDLPEWTYKEAEAITGGF